MINVDIWSIISITEVSRIFRVNYQLTMKWRDTRLRFFNLKRESYLNMVALNESLSIWYPIAVFQNTLNRDKSKVTVHVILECIIHFNFLQHDSESAVTIIRSGSFSTTPKESIRNDHIYSGKDNSISITRTYNTDFDCDFQMEYFPFDIQQCNMNFILGVL